MRHLPLLLLLPLLACDPIAPGIERGVLRDLAAIAHGNDGFVAAGSRRHVRDDFLVAGSDSALVARSPDGSAWTVSPLAHPGALVDVAYGGGVWIAVGAGPGPADAGVVLRSVDAETWTVVEGPALRWRSVVHENGMFLGIGYDDASGLEVLATSPAGTEWEVRAATELVSPRLATGDGLFAMWGEAGRVWVSVDGAAWDVTSVPPLNRVTALAYAEGEWTGFGVEDCCAGEEPDEIEYYRIRSADGVTWGVQRVDDREFVMAFARSAERWVAVTGNGLVRSSTPGDWLPALGQPDPTLPPFDVTRGDGTFVAVGRETAWWSVDGVAWTAVPLD